MKRILIFSPLLLSLVLSCACFAQTDEQVFEPGSDPALGFNLVSWANFGSNGPSVWENAVQSVYDSGFSEVSLTPVRFYTLGNGSIAGSSSSGAELSHVAAGVLRAKSLGMTVTVNPMVEPVNFTEWRGLYDPTPNSSESNTFWNDYTNFISDTATMAQNSGADSLNIGSELRGLVRNSGNNASWGSVIAAADNNFSGSLGYAANWDNYNDPNIGSAIWDNPAIDYLGIDAYFTDIVSSSEASASGSYPNENFINAARDGWNEKIDNEILPYAQNRQGGNGLPVKFTEVGYLPLDQTGVTPQNESGSLDIDEQNMMFEGLMRALDGRLADDDILAAHIWQWDMPGSEGSLWNLDPNGGSEPNNQQTAQWLSEFASTRSIPEPNAAVLLGIMLVTACTKRSRRC